MKSVSILSPTLSPQRYNRKTIESIKKSRSVKITKTFDISESELRTPTLPPSNQTRNILLISDKIATSKKSKNRCLEHQPFKYLYNPDPQDTEQYLKDHLMLREEIKTAP